MCFVCWLIERIFLFDCFLFEGESEISRCGVFGSGFE